MLKTKSITEYRNSSSSSKVLNYYRLAKAIEAIETVGSIDKYRLAKRCKSVVDDYRVWGNKPVPKRLNYYRLASHKYPIAKEYNRCP